MIRCRYFLKLLGLDSVEVTKQEFIRAERSAGFTNKNGEQNEIATGGFGNGTISGRVEYVVDDSSDHLNVVCPRHQPEAE